MTLRVPDGNQVIKLTLTDPTGDGSYGCQDHIFTPADGSPDAAAAKATASLRSMGYDPARYAIRYALPVGESAQAIATVAVQSGKLPRRVANPTIPHAVVTLVADYGTMLIDSRANTITFLCRLPIQGEVARRQRQARERQQAYS